MFDGMLVENSRQTSVRFSNIGREICVKIRHRAGVTKAHFLSRSRKSGLLERLTWGDLSR